MLEPSICAMEKFSGCSITLIDNDHVFGRRRPRAVFTELRSSHRKNAVCQCGFDERCIRHCRNEMNRRSLSAEGSFTSCCWKGLREIVVPLTDGHVHCGMLYAGIWRVAEANAPPGLPDEFYLLRDALPELTPERESELRAVFETYAAGIVETMRKLNLLDLPPDSRSASIAGFLRRRAAGPVGLPDLAEALNLSESRTSFLVRELFGKTFTELLRLERIGRARHLLLSTDFPLRQIAPLCGFRDEFHLSRLFRQLTSTSPGSYRRSAREALAAGRKRKDF